MFIGRQIDVGIGKEGIRGQAVAPDFWTPKIDATVEDKVELATDETSVGIIEDSIGAEVAKRWAEGEIVGNVRDKSFGLILLSALGKVASIARTPITPVAYDHTFEVEQSATHQSLTIGAKSPVQQLRFALAVINSLEIRFELAKFVEFTANFLSRVGAVASDTVSYLTENQFLAHQIEIRTAPNLSELGGATPIKVKNVTIEIAKNAEASDVLGNIEPDNYFNKQMEITGSFDLLYEDITYKQLFLDGQSIAMRIDVTNPTEIQTGVNPRMRIDLAKVKFPEWTREGGLNDVVSQTVSFKAYYSLADAQSIKVILTNNQSSY